MSSKETNPNPHPPAIAVVVPVHNEEDNIQPLVSEIRQALEPVAAFETIYVDDGSTDRTVSVLRELAATDTALRVVVHQVRYGQSAAVTTGVLHARAPLIATLDGDGQNDPADIPALMDEWGTNPNNGCLLIAGHRLRRKDSGIKRIASRVANNVRAFFLKDDTPDTGCGLKVFAKSAFLDLPRFDHMHRYLPALFIRAGGRVVSVPVNHRPRERGTSKYGVIDRLVVGVHDVIGVGWLLRRGNRPLVDAGRSIRHQQEGDHS